jgi:hypothetical protein
MIACPASAGEPHMIENYVLFVFVTVVNHVGFILSNLWIHEEYEDFRINLSENLRKSSKTAVNI